MSVKFVRPGAHHIIHVAENMRQADMVEVWASHRMTPIEALIASVELSHFCSVAIYKDSPCAIFGLVQAGLLTGTGRPWLLGTDDIDLCKRDFVRHTKSGVQEMLEVCPVLENYVHVDNTKSVRWLKAMGFQFEEPQPVGMNGELFAKFSMRK